MKIELKDGKIELKKDIEVGIKLPLNFNLKRVKIKNIKIKFNKLVKNIKFKK